MPPSLSLPASTPSPLAVRAALFALLCGLSPAVANACSLRFPAEPVGELVLYAQVVDYVESTYLGEPAWGIRVVPQIEYRNSSTSTSTNSNANSNPNPRTAASYELYPMGLAADCSSVPRGDRAEIESTFPIGRSVGIVASHTTGTAYPGDIQANHPGLLSVVAPDCRLVDLDRRRLDYGQYALGQPIQCGSVRFDVNKDIATLDRVGPAASIEILERIAEYSGRLSYMDLLGRHVPDPSEGAGLIALRYGDTTEVSCEPGEVDGAVGSIRRLRAEYCASHNPYDAAGEDTEALYGALRDGRLDAVRRFLAEGGSPNTVLRRTPEGDITALMVAIRARRDVLALELLEAGADFSSSGVRLGRIAQLGLIRVMEYLVHNASDQLDLAQHVPGLVRAACVRGAAGYYDLIALLSRSFDLRTLPSAARMAESVGVCLMDGRMDAARLLIERGAVVDTTTLWGAARGDVSPGMIRELIALGADPAARVPRDGELEGPYDGFAAIDYVWNRSFAWGSPPDSSAAPYVLHELAVVGPPPLSGARLEDIAIDGLDEVRQYADEPRAQLLAAARIGYYFIVDELLAGGTLSRDDLTAAAIAAIEVGHTDIARRLFDAGADVRGGALHAAARTGEASIVRQLLALGADPNEIVAGETPLAAWLSSPLAPRTHEALFALASSGAEACWLFERLDPRSQAMSLLRLAAPDCR